MNSYTETGAGSFTFNGGGGTVTLTLGRPSAPPLPPCADCGEPSLHRSPAGPLCYACWHYHCVYCALDVLFDRAPKSLHSRLYRQLSLAYHPDTGCDDNTFIRALNAAKEKWLP